MDVELAGTGGPGGAAPGGIFVPNPDGPTRVPDVQALPHFLCYTAETSPPYGRNPVTFRDGFGTRTAYAGDRNRICNPVGLDGQQPFDAETHMVCYGLTDASGAPLPPIATRVPFVTEWGVGVLVIGRPKLLCAPASKIRLDQVPGGVPAAPPATVNAYACYEAQARQGSRGVTLVDEFADAYTIHGFEAIAPEVYCSPAQLPGIPVPQPELALLCELLDPAETLDVPIATNDAFGGEARMKGEVTNSLCLPALGR